MSIRQDSIAVEKKLEDALIFLMSARGSGVATNRSLRLAIDEIRSALDIVAEMRVPARAKRSARVARETSLTGMEQELPL